jgi:hypothetical protein
MSHRLEFGQGLGYGAFTVWTRDSVLIMAGEATGFSDPHHALVLTCLSPRGLFDSPGQRTVTESIIDDRCCPREVPAFVDCSPSCFINCPHHKSQFQLSVLSRLSCLWSAYFDMWRRNILTPRAWQWQFSRSPKTARQASQTWLSRTARGLTSGRLSQAKRTR